MGLVILLAAPAAIAAPQADRAARDDEGRREFRLGPLVGVGFPRPIAVEAFAKFHDMVGAGLEYSFMPRVRISDADTSFHAVAADLRVFPVRGGPFFIGLRGGRQWLDARASLDGYTETLAASAWFVNPRVGLLYTWSSGITLGIDAGVQIPISPTYERSGPATARGLARGTDTEGTLQTVANVLGNRVTPTVDLLRIGYLF